MVADITDGKRMATIGHVREHKQPSVNTLALQTKVKARRLQAKTHTHTHRASGSQGCRGATLRLLQGKIPIGARLTWLPKVCFSLY